MNRRTSRAATAALAGVLLAACGSSTSSPATTKAPASTAAAAATTAASATTVAATMAPATTAAAAGDIVAVAAGNPDFTTLVAAVKAAGLVSTLQGAGPFTVFAPTNEAFAKLPAGLVDTLLKPENKAVLVKILTYHVLPAKVMAADVKPGNATTVEGDPIAITVASGKVMLNASTTVVATDVAASNGVIHVIDSVLLPPGVDPSKLSSPATTAAPATTDAAATTAASATTAAAATGDIVAVAAGNKDFSTLVAAVKAAGLVSTLQGPGPFTVFAPTDEAFAKLPAGLVDKLLKPENKAVLVKILTYHVLPAKVMAADVKPGNATTVEGDPIAITVASGKVMLNGSTTVVATDVAASNGVIHVIDSVLLPPGVDPSKL